MKAQHVERERLTVEKTLIVRVNQLVLGKKASVESLLVVGQKDIPLAGHRVASLVMNVKKEKLSVLKILFIVLLLVNVQMGQFVINVKAVALLCIAMVRLKH